MTDYHVSATLSPADREAILQVIATIREKLPLLVDLTTEEVNNLPTLDERNWEYVSKALEVAQNKDLLPPANPQKKYQTLQEILKQRQQSSFVGREEQIAIFRQNLELPIEDHHRRFIFNVCGQGGVGKSSLLRQFRQIAENAKAIAASTDEFEKSVPEVMGHLAQQLEHQGYILPHFDESYKKYRQKLQELEIDPEIPQGFSAFVGRTLAQSDVYLKQQIPGTNVILEFADHDFEVIQQDWSSYVARKLINKDDLRLLQEPVAILTPLFLKDLWQVAANSGIALFFDTYDRTEEFLDKWLREILDGRYGDVPPNILLVIAGRQELDKNHWKFYEESMVRLGLEPFTDEEVRQYLTRKGITDNQIIDVILRLSERLPLLVALLATEAPNDTSKVGDAQGMVVERFLKWVKEPKWRQLALIAALPRFLHRDVLTQLRPEEETDKLLSWLQQMPFMKAHPNGGWAYHEVAKTIMLRHKRLSSAQNWAELHGKLADYYDSQSKDLQLDEEKKWCDETWQSNKLNMLYHRLCQSPHQHLPLALNEFLAALNKQYNFAQRLAETIIQAGKDADATEVHNWGERLSKGLKAWKVQQYEVTAEMFAALIEHGKIHAKWRALAFNFKGATHYIMKNYEEALKSLNQAIKLDPTQDSAIELRGYVYCEKKRYLDAIKNFDRLIKFDPDRPSAMSDGKPQRIYAQRGYTYHLMKRYEQALQDFNRALELDPNCTWVRIQRGYNYLVMQRYTEALQDFDCVLEFELDRPSAISDGQPSRYSLRSHPMTVNGANSWSSRVPQEELPTGSIGINELERCSDWRQGATKTVTPSVLRVYALRGVAYQFMGLYTEAIKEFDRFLAFEPDCIQVMEQRGAAHYLLKNYVEAAQDFKRILEFEPDRIQVLALRGATYQLMEHYIEAVQDFDRVIELDPKNKWAIAQRGETYRQIECYTEALQDFDTAIELGANDAWIIASRGDTYHSIGRNEEALKNFDHAIALDCNYTWAIVRRSEIYQTMRRYEEALREFDRALELDCNCTRAITSRGKTYQLMGCYDKALKDFDRAIQFKPKDISIIVTRGETYQLIGHYDQALKDFNYVLELDPIHDRAIVSRGKTYQLMGRCEEALKDFNRALELDPNNDKALAGCGYTYWIMNQHEQALKDFNRAIEINPNNDSALAGRGYAYLMQKHYNEAVADISRAIELNANEHKYLYLRYLAYQALNQPRQALADLAIAIKFAKKRYEADSQDWRNTLNIALYYLAIQYYSTVESIYQYALSKGSSLEHIREAIRDLDDFLTIFPDYIQAKSMRELLQSAFN